MTMKTIHELRRYAAKLLFQFRWETDGISNRKRICEELVIHVSDISDERALRQVRRIARKKEFDYHLDSKHIFYEFIGIPDLREFGIELDPDEVWWEFREMLTPMERKDQIIPDKEELSVFKNPATRRKKGRVRFPVSSGDD